jgi:hypothetical protein
VRAHGGARPVGLLDDLCGVFGGHG